MERQEQGPKVPRPQHQGPARRWRRQLGRPEQGPKGPRSQRQGPAQRHQKLRRQMQKQGRKEGRRRGKGRLAAPAAGQPWRLRRRRRLEKEERI